jgi:hypothetical protein
MTATRQPERIGSARAIAAMHKAAHVVRDWHEEVVIGTEAVLRPVGLPRHNGAPAAPSATGNGDVQPDHVS